MDKVFIDFLTLLLASTAAGMFTLGLFVINGIDSERRTSWAPALGITGMICLIGGLYMAFIWPLPGAFNSAYGELSALFGALLVGASWGLSRNLSLKPMSAFAFVAGLVALLVAARFVSLGMSQKPLITAAGFALAGIAGLGASLILHKPQMAILKYAGAAVLWGSGFIWLVTALGGFWAHMAFFAKWLPPTLR